MRLKDILTVAEGAPVLTRADLESALALKQSGLAWDQVASKFGTTANSLKVRVNRLKKGEVKDRLATKLDRDTRMEDMVAQGMSVPEIAAALGMTYGAAHSRLLSIGLDQEMRQELRSDYLKSRGNTKH